MRVKDEITKIHARIAHLETQQQVETDIDIEQIDEDEDDDTSYSVLTEIDITKLVHKTFLRYNLRTAAN